MRKFNMQRLLKAEMWDKMQYLFRNYYDRMMHIALYYKGDILVDIFKQAVSDMLDAVPVLRSKYHNNFIKPYWVISKKYDIDKVVIEAEGKDYEAILNNFLTQTISVKSPVQIRFIIVKSVKITAVGVLINHMCFDGGDAKKILSTLIANYNAIARGWDKKEYRTGRRDYKQVYDNFSDEDKRIAMKLYKNISAVKSKQKFPLTRSKLYDKNLIHKIKLEPDLVSEFKEIGKKYDATLNDMYLTAYITTLYKMGLDKNKPLTIPCMVNLRRHIPFDGEKEGYTNHTGFMNCAVSNCGKTFEETLALVKQSTDVGKKDKFIGLYGLPLLNLGYTIFPQFLSEMVIRLGYTNPLIGMSNIGIIPEDGMLPYGAKLIDGFITGAIKHKPYVQLAVSSCLGGSTLSIAVKGNRNDSEIVNNFLISLKRTIYEFVKNNSYME